MAGGNLEGDRLIKHGAEISNESKRAERDEDFIESALNLLFLRSKYASVDSFV